MFAASQVEIIKFFAYNPGWFEYKNKINIKFHKQAMEQKQ